MHSLLQRLIGKTEKSMRDQWIERCAQRYIERARIPAEDARTFAEACWDQRTSDDDSPVDAADEDMSYWEAE